MQTHSNGIKTRSMALRALRVVLVPVVTAALTAVVARATLTAVRPVFAPGPTNFAELLVALIALLALLLLVGQCLSMALGLLGSIPGLIGRGARLLDAALTPAFMRRITAMTLGGVITAGLLPGTTLADTGRSGVRVSVVAPDVSFGLSRATQAPPVGFVVAPDQAEPERAAPEVGFVPDRPAVRAVPTPQILGGTAMAPPDGIVVHRGDSLWAIAARALGPQATEAQIAAEWPRWYAANRRVIGADPDLILPGTVLRPPSTTAPAHR